MQTLRRAALAVLLESDPGRKAELARALDRSMPAGADEALDEPPGLPGRPARPELVPHTQLQQRSIRTIEGRAALLHSIAHIELNAIDLAADAVWRYPGQAAQFYVDWALVAQEEGLHFQLLREHLRSLGFDYGGFPAHNGLWEMARKTRGDLLARLALVPRTLEARGLDASPAVKAKLVGAGDHQRRRDPRRHPARRDRPRRDRQPLVRGRMRGARAGAGAHGRRAGGAVRGTASARPVQSRRAARRRLQRPGTGPARGDTGRALTGERLLSSPAPFRGRTS
jgi:uncharacterized ferritin-like protein (DUF455 family)